VRYVRHRKIVLLTATAALAAGLAVTGPAAPANALARDCTGGTNGFTDISDSASGTRQVDVQASTPDGAVDLTVQSIQLGHLLTLNGFAKISGPTRPGDMVWMDWTQDNGKTWLQCGPFTVGSNNQSLTTPAKPTSTDGNYRFRVGGVVHGKLYVSNWW